MFENKLGLRENPFLAGHNPQYVYRSQEHQEALAHLSDAIQNREPYLLITGDAGTGKSTAVYDALGEWGSRAVVALISNPKLARGELIEEITLRFSAGSPDPRGGPEAAPQLEPLLGAIRARGDSAILLLDNAHDLDHELLAEVGQLSHLDQDGEPLLQVFLVGRPALEAKFAHPDLRELRQRIHVHHRMSPLSASDTAQYIHNRVGAAGGSGRALFPADACIEVFQISNGYPREINLVAGQALLNALGEGSPAVTMDHVAAVEREIEFQGALRDQARAITPLAPMAEPFAEREPDMDPEPLETEILSMMESAPDVQPEPHARPKPVVRREPKSAPTPVAKVGSVLSVPVTNTDAPLQILPSWFDEVVARRQQIDKEEAAAGSTPATVPSQPVSRTHDASPIPIAAPSASAPTFAPVELTPEPLADAEAFVPSAETSSPSAYASTDSSLGLPVFVPLEPAMSSESESADAASSRMSIISAPPESTRGPGPVPMPLEALAARLRAEFAEVEQQAAAKRTGFGWLVGATIVAIVAIAAILLIRLGLWTVHREEAVPAATTAPQATAPAPAPAVQKPRPTPVSADAGPQTQEPAPSSSGTASQTAAKEVEPNSPATSEATPQTTVTAKEAPVATSTPSTMKPGSQPAAPVAAVAPPRIATARSAKKAAAVADLFGVAVGTYLDEARAISERTRLTESTRLPSRVVAVIEDTVSMYRVVVGSFNDRTSAERAASDLVNRGLVDEARVVPLARTTPPPQ